MSESGIWLMCVRVWKHCSSKGFTFLRRDMRGRRMYFSGLRAL